jgi:energy-coupling factor transporter ATP-binding protein EcfA2
MLDINDLDKRTEQAARQYYAAPLDEQEAAPDDADAQQRQPQSDKLVEFALARLTLFHDMNKDSYARDIKTGEARRLDSRSFKDWLAAGFYSAEGKSPRGQSLSEALGTLSALARYDGEQHKVNIRIAKVGDEYYLDLCEQGRSRAVRWSASGWHVVDADDVLFVRGEAMQPLPVPERRGSLDALWQTCNIPVSDRPLVLAWIIDALRADTVFPGLEVMGEQGSGKSTTSEALRRLIDPNGCNLRGAPKTTEDLFVTAGASHVVAYENLSHIPATTQDGLCILSTGAGYAKRKLYSDADESVISVKRPWIVNAISSVVTQQDLLDRTICIECPMIRSRTASADQWALFDQELPSILGALFDLAVAALKVLPTVKIPAADRPRLIEYAHLGMAITQVLNGDPQQFLSLFKDNRRDSVARTIDNSPVCTAIIELMEARNEITATVKDLLRQLESYRPDRCDSWPRSAKGLGDALRRSAPALRHLDIDCVCLGKIGGSVRWSIKKK